VCVNLPTYLTDSPWDLLIVIEKAKRMKNCLVKINGSSPVDGPRETRGMKANYPEWSTVSIRASIIRSEKRTTRRRDPLQRPSRGAKLRNNIIGHPGLSSNLCGGRSDGFREFKNSVGYTLSLFAPSSDMVLSALSRFS